jgi:uncharacterized membrane protein
MKHDDKFPPNAFLKRTIMKTPSRALSFIVAILAAMMAGLKWYPDETRIVSFWGMIIWIFVVIVIVSWHIAWIVKNPYPPRLRCDKCKQYLPEDE